MYTTKEVKAGEEFFISYGVRSNTFNFLYHGFVDMKHMDMDLSLEFCIPYDDELRNRKVEMIGGNQKGCIMV